MAPHRASVTIAAAWLLTGLLLSCEPGRGTRVVLITVDTLRSDSFAGSPGPQTSNP